MKYKIMGIFSLIFVVALTLAAASAADNNATDEIVSMENTHNEDAVNVEQSNDDKVVENDSNQKSEAHTNDVLGASCENEVVLKSASETPVLASAVTAPVKLTASQTEPILKKSSIYKTFKGKSKYTWKIKKTTWNKMKKQAIKQYKSFRSYGSFHPGYSKGISVVVKKGGHKYRGTAFAVKNSRGIRCEVRGLPHGIRASNWGDY